MDSSLYPRELVASRLSVTTRTLLLYEQRGLVSVVRQGEVEGYRPAELRRLWSIVTLQRDLGINLNGVEAILQLQDQMRHVHRRLAELADDLRTVVDDERAGG